MSLEDIKKNLKETIDRGGNEDVVAKLQKKLNSLNEKQINKKG